MNLEDIAKKVGVSRSTVSRVINGKPHVSEATRLKVLATIEQEGFSPNPVARALVTQQSRVIGVVIPQPLRDVFSPDEPYYFATLIQGIADTTHQQAYAMLLWLGTSDEEETRFYQRVLHNRMMDGLIIIASMNSVDFLVEQLVNSSTPFVMIGRPGRYQDQISSVSIDNVNAARQAVQHLYDTGHRRIGTITGDLDNTDARDRLTGYQTALDSLGLPVQPELIAEGRFSYEWGYRCMRQLMQHEVDAVFAASDRIALGAADAAREAGYTIPDDIAIIGFDDLPDASQATPTLTTIRQPVLQKSVRAAHLLLNLIEGKTTTPQQVVLPTQLVIRRSCGA
jgi:DNA-binding LacI/PurR family transcriptional regulator